MRDVRRGGRVARTPSQPEVSMAEPFYEISFRGTPSDLLRAEFSDVHLRVRRGVTYLRIEADDHAELYGLIGRIEGLGLELLEVRRGKGTMTDD
jgi:hypothetical protein